MFSGVEGTSGGRKLVIILALRARGQAVHDALGKNSPSSKRDGM